MAIKGNTLYADAYGDLVTSISPIPRMWLRKILRRMFFPIIAYIISICLLIREQLLIRIPSMVVGWNTRDTTVDYDPGTNYFFIPVVHIVPPCLRHGTGSEPGRPGCNQWFHSQVQHYQ
jgi:hypothetical protein